MEVKKNGKVEHSQNSHDDQVFSYLMALYVWYDGKNLAERFHIVKNTIKTDTDVDIEALEIEDSLEATEKVDLESSVYDPDAEILQDLEWVESNVRMITSVDLRNEYYTKTNQSREILLSTNKDARIAYAKETGVDPQMYANGQYTTFVTLPDTLFMDNDLDMEEDNNVHSVLAGNMKDWWDRV